jgi:HEPN domain-containing protein
VNDSLAEAQRWLRFAGEDLRQAEAILAQHVFVPRHACWLAQQAAEKAMKAVLVAEGVAFPRTHDLDHLRTLIPAGRAVSRTAADLSALSEYAVDARYPGDWPDLMAVDADAAVNDAALLMAEARRDVALLSDGE